MNMSKILDQHSYGLKFAFDVPNAMLTNDGMSDLDVVKLMLNHQYVDKR